MGFLNSNTEEHLDLQRIYGKHFSTKVQYLLQMENHLILQENRCEEMSEVAMNM